MESKHSMPGCGHGRLTDEAGFYRRRFGNIEAARRRYLRITRAFNGLDTTVRTVALSAASIIVALGILALQTYGCADPSIVSPTGADESTVMKIALSPTYPPFQGIDPDTGEIAGFEVDMLREIANSGGFEIEFIIVGEYPSIAEAENDQTNAIVAPLSSAYEENPGYECSQPYYGDSVICVKKGNEDLLASVNRGIEALPEDTVANLKKKWGM